MRWVAPGSRRRRRCCPRSAAPRKARPATHRRTGRPSAGLAVGTGRHLVVLDMQGHVGGAAARLQQPQPRAPRHSVSLRPTRADARRASRARGTRPRPRARPTARCSDAAGRALMPRPATSAWRRPPTANAVVGRQAAGSSGRSCFHDHHHVARPRRPGAIACCVRRRRRQACRAPSSIRWHQGSRWERRRGS
jgi:hypothetical protein